MDYMEPSIRMRVTQVLERSRISTMPVSISFRTKTIWYAFLYWLFQSFIIACVYGNSAWFLPLFNLVTVGWAWDKITSEHSSLVESVINVENSPNTTITPDLERGNRTQRPSQTDSPPRVHIPRTSTPPSSSDMFSPATSITESEFQYPLFSSYITRNNPFGSESVQTGSIIGPEANPVISLQDDNKEREAVADNIGNAIDSTIADLRISAENINKN
jgi:hypothetical protein